MIAARGDSRCVFSEQWLKVVDRGDALARDSTSSKDRFCQPFCTLIMAYVSRVRSCWESYLISAFWHATLGTGLTSTTVALLPFDRVLILLDRPVWVNFEASGRASLTSPFADLFLPATALWGDNCPFTGALVDCSSCPRTERGDMGDWCSDSLLLAGGLLSLEEDRLSAC